MISGHAPPPPTARGRRRGEGATLYALACVVCALSFAFPATASAAETYACERAPKKLALVIGNEEYTNLERLPSARTDAEGMRDRLTDLGFDVTFHLNVKSRGDFQSEVFRDFRRKIDEGDLVLFYFSGHGFSYGQHNYLVPTEMPLNINEEGVRMLAISVDSFESLVASHDPGLTMFFIDACRTLGGFVIKGPGDTNLVDKGPAEQRNHELGVNSAIFYATKPGAVAVGSAATGETSVYTRHLLAHIGTEGKPFQSVYHRVIAEVRVNTGDKQFPGIYFWSSTDPFLKPTARNLEEQKESWQSVIEARDYDSVKVFYYLNSVSACADAARKWLKNNVAAASRYTRASPVAIDRSWRADNQERVSVRRLALPQFAFMRTLDADETAELSAASDAELGLVPAGTTPRVSDPLVYGLAAIDAHETVVATRTLVGRADPSASARVVKSIPSGTQIQINGVTVGADSGTYVSASTPGAGEPFFVRILESVEVLQPLQLGLSLKEVVAPPRPDSIPDLASPDPIEAALAELKSQGWTITWVSLATAPTDDELEQNRRTVRLLNAEHILKRAGVDGTRITSVSGREGFSGDGVRVRFFGIRSSHEEE